MTKNGIKKIGIILLVGMMRLCVNAVLFMGCLFLVGAAVDKSFLLRIISLFVLSWVVGFLTPGAPGGLGVRETVMCFFLGSIVGNETILYSSLIYRVVCVLGDVAAFALGVSYVKMIYVKTKRAAQNKPESQ